MSHDHNYKVQEDLTISIWGNSCILPGNIARILQINQSCFALCIVMSSHGSYRSVIFVMFFLLFWFHWYSKRYQAMSNRWEQKLEQFLFQNDPHFRRKSWFRNLVGLNSPYEFSTAYSANNRADSLHRKLLSYRQNRNDAKIYSGARSSFYFNNHPPFPPFFFFFFAYSRAVARYFMWRAREYAIRHVS